MKPFHFTMIETNTSSEENKASKKVSNKFNHPMKLNKRSITDLALKSTGTGDHPINSNIIWQHFIDHANVVNLSCRGEIKFRIYWPGNK